MASSSKQMFDFLTCPICLELMYPPIYQCLNGHRVCSTCKAKIGKKCPTCKSEQASDVRCLVLEQMADLIEFSCKYEAAGCDVKLKCYGKLEHEKQCKFRPFECPYSTRGCQVKGSILDIVSHLKSSHYAMEVDTSFDDNHYLRYRYPTLGLAGNQDWTTWTTPIQIYKNRNGEFFGLRCETVKEKYGIPILIVYMQYIGEKEEALTYLFSIEVLQGDRKITWQGSPTSIRDIDVHNNLDGAVLLQHRPCDGVALLPKGIHPDKVHVIKAMEWDGGGVQHTFPHCSRWEQDLVVSLAVRSTSDMKIYVVIVALGETYTIYVNASDTLNVLKEKIQDQTHKTNLDRQCFTFRGAELHEGHDRTLRQHNIQAESTILILEQQLVSGGISLEGLRKFGDNGIQKAATSVTRICNYQIFVKNLDGKTQTYYVQSSDTVASLKTKIQEKQSIAFANYTLNYEGKVLRDDDTLDSYNIRKEATVHLRVRASSQWEC